MIRLLIIIYLAFISLGLPDSLLGAAWPVMHTDIGAPMSSAGVISIITCGGTVISSLFSNRLIHRFKTGKVTFVSVFVTAISLFGISFSNSMILVCFLAIPLGLGAGSVDAALNNFVSLHYNARHMNWLHCFWGVGATAGPIIMAFFLAREGGWHSGYFAISMIQFSVAFVLLLSLPMWRKVESGGILEHINADVTEGATVTETAATKETTEAIETIDTIEITDTTETAATKETAEAIETIDTIEITDTTETTATKEAIETIDTIEITDTTETIEITETAETTETKDTTETIGTTEVADATTVASTAFVSNREVIKRPGVKYALIAFLCYCGYEISAGLWAASYLTSQEGFTPELAANSASLYYAGITVGRMISGFISSKLRSQNLIRIGCCITLLGILTLILPLPELFSIVGFILIGLGSAPFYPMMIHETPARFGKKYSRAAMGLQMATAYIGSTFLPPLIGLLSEYLTLSVLPWILLVLALGAFAFSEKVAHVTK
ncbi:MAG: MFS transporter [Clostridiales Family XIII bacterium]|nr:MFS transporter [Clostridiales Family XIII bacterium]